MLNLISEFKETFVKFLHNVKMFDLSNLVVSTGQSKIFNSFKPTRDTRLEYIHLLVSEWY